MGERFSADVPGRRTVSVYTEGSSVPRNYILQSFGFKVRVKSVTFTPERAIAASSSGKVTIETKKDNAGSALSSNTYSANQAANTAIALDTSADDRFDDGETLTASVSLESGYPEFPPGLWEIEYEPDYDQS